MRVVPRYESGDTTALENLIARGHLSDTPGLSAGFDASELDTDLGSLGLDSNDFLGMFDNDRNQASKAHTHQQAGFLHPVKHEAKHEQGAESAREKIKREDE